MATGCDQRSPDHEGGSLVEVSACTTESCAISALLGPFHRKWGHQASHDSKGFPWNGGVRTCATGSREFLPIRESFDRKWRHQTSPVGLPLEVTIGSALGVLSRMSASYYRFLALSLVIYSFPAIFTGSAFNNGFHLLCFRICSICTPSSLSRPHCILLYFQRSFSVLFINCSFFLYIFRELLIYSDASWFLSLIFVFIQHLNHYFVDLLQFCHRCLR